MAYLNRPLQAGLLAIAGVRACMALRGLPHGLLSIAGELSLSAMATSYHVLLGCIDNHQAGRQRAGQNSSWPIINDSGDGKTNWDQSPIYSSIGNIVI
jgi:hypothetical protein